MRIPRHYSAAFFSCQPEDDLGLSQAGRRAHVGLPEPGTTLIRLVDLQHVLQGDPDCRKLRTLGTVRGEREALGYGSGRITVVGSLNERADAVWSIDVTTC